MVFFALSFDSIHPYFTYENTRKSNIARFFFCMVKYSKIY